MIHRVWRYRLVAERTSMTYLLSKDLKNTTAIDLGANKGAYTYWLSKQVGKNGKVLAVEPQPELGVHLQAFKQSFGLRNVSLIQKAASDHERVVLLKRQFPGHGGATIVGNQSVLTIPVSTFRLDDMKYEQPVSFIKCDVEGHELSALRGASELIGAYHPTLLVEVHHEAALSGELFDFLESKGYSGLYLKSGQRINCRDFNKYPYPRKDNHRNYIFEPLTSSH
ncbi:MAG: FkbM family methyltransferase [Marinoscillum sp.]